MSATQEPTPDNEKLDFKRILPIFVIVLVDLLGLTIIIPLLALYATTFGASPFVVGLLAGAYPLMQFIGAPILGRLSDRYGRRPVLIISQFGTLLGFLLLGFANSLLLLFISRIIDGISGANIATAQAAIADSTTEKTRTQGLGLIGAAFGLGFTIGPVIAFVALAATGNDYRAPAFIAALFSLASILLTVFWFEETLPAEKRGQNSKRPSLSFGAMVDAIKHPTVGLLLILIFLQHLAFGGFEQLLALFTLSRLGLNGSGNAAVFFYVGVVLVAVQGGFIGKWSRRYGDRRLVFGGLALLAVGLTAVGLTPRQPVPWYSEEAILSEMSSTDTNSETVNVNDVPIELPDEANKSWLGLLWMLLAMTPIAIGGGLLQPTLNSLITKRTDPLDVGGMLGVSAAFLSAANFFGPIIGGAIFQSAGATALFLGWGLLMAVLLVIALRYLKPGQEENSPTGLARGGAH